MKAENIVEKIFDIAGKIDTEVIFERKVESLTRFGDNEISQNVSSQSMSASIRIIKDGRIFRFSLNQFDNKSVKTAFELAKKSLKFQKKDKTILPLVSGIKPLRVSNFNNEVSSLDPYWKAQRIKDITDICSRKNMSAYGILKNGFIEILVANSKGIFHSYDESFIDYEITVRCGEGYGIAFEYSNKKDIDFEAVNKIAIDKAIMSKNPVSIKPGIYDVILEQQPANELLSFLCFYGFSAQGYLEKKTFVSETLGKKIFPSNINIVDNLDGANFSIPFDFEGCPRKRVELITDGVVKNIVTDRKTAKALRIPNTGHSLPQPNSLGPIPFNVEMKTGDTSIEDMIKNTERAIYVTQFHYTNCLKPKNIEMTGMTRNGTFLVEDGRVKKALKNLRFTQSAVESFKNISDIGDKAISFRGYFMKTSCPALKIKNFNFSSETKF